MKENLILNLVEDMDKILYTFEKDGKFAMSSSIRNELFQEANKSLKQVKEYLAQQDCKNGSCNCCWNEAAQPEQEPVAYASSVEWRKHQLMSKAQYDNCLPKNRKDFDMPLYTAPPKREWVGLTEEQIKEISESIWGSELDYKCVAEIQFARAIETKLKEENT